MNLASYIDHSLLKPAATGAELDQLCAEALRYRFAAVCIPPPMVRRAGEMLSGSGIRVATVIGFPFGYSATGAKLAEVREAIADGANELDAVINLVHLKGGHWDLLETEISRITDTAHEHHRKIKVIIETGLLTDPEIIRCCELFGGLGVDFLKTSTGYTEKGASLEAVVLMKKHLPPGVGIKASGGIRTYDFARQLVMAGATRLGCSASVAIVTAAPPDDSGGY